MFDYVYYQILTAACWESEVLKTVIAVFFFKQSKYIPKTKESVTKKAASLEPNLIFGTKLDSNLTLIFLADTIFSAGCCDGNVYLYSVKYRLVSHKSLV